MVVVQSLVIGLVQATTGNWLVSAVNLSGDPEKCPQPMYIIVYIYIHIYTHMIMCIYVYIYIHIDIDMYMCINV